MPTPTEITVDVVRVNKGNLDRQRVEQCRELLHRQRAAPGSDGCRSVLDLSILRFAGFQVNLARLPDNSVGGYVLSPIPYHLYPNT